MSNVSSDPQFVSNALEASIKIAVMVVLGDDINVKFNQPGEC